MKNNFSIIFLLMLILTSCSEPENRFIDVDKANAKILEQSGIDILALRDQIEKDFDVDEHFYNSILVETSEMNTNKIFRKYGYYSVRTNGDTITDDDLDSLYFQFAKGLAHGIIQEKCTSSDSLCTTKMELYERLSQMESPYGRVENEIPYFFYSKFSQKGYVTQDELSFLTLWWYILSSAQSISDIEWHEAQKKKSKP